MSTYALGSVFSPTSVAVVGASPRERSLGRLVLRQLREGGFAGPVGLVNPNYREIDGMASAPRLDALGFAPELVVIAAPPRDRSEEHTSELQSLMRISYAVFCLKKKN